MTVLLTTQYLDEAEQLADRTAILHGGRIMVNGTLSELKQLLPPAKVEYVEKQPTLEDVFLTIVGDTRKDGGQTRAAASGADRWGAAMSKHFFGDAAVLLGRSLRHISRSPDTISTTALMPIGFMLLFVYVFGGAINSGSHSYVSYLLPGILLTTIASGISYTAYRLFLDKQSGIFERFHSMPIARSSVLWGHVPTSLVANLVSLVVVVLVALLMGFRSGAGVLAWLAIAGILSLFTLALTWPAVIPCQRDPRPVHPAAGRHRPLDRPWLVCRHFHRRVHLRHGPLPPQDGLVLIPGPALLQDLRQVCAEPPMRAKLNLLDYQAACA